MMPDNVVIIQFSFGFTTVMTSEEGQGRSHIYLRLSNTIDEHNRCFKIDEDPVRTRLSQAEVHCIK